MTYKRTYKKVSMDSLLLAIIIAVQAYKDFVISDFIARGFKESNFDWYEKVQEYFKSLELPHNIIKNQECLDAFLAIPKSEIDKMADMTNLIDCYYFYLLCKEE